MDINREIIRIFKTAQRNGKSISPHTIEFLLGIQPDDSHKKLKMFEKYGFIKPSTVKKVRFYRVIRS